MNRRTVILLALLVFTTLGPAQTYHFKNYNIEDGLPQSQVRALLQDSRGYLWIGTYGGGASRFDGVSFKNFNRKDGLPDTNILCIFEDSGGNLWFGTFAGACKYDGKHFTFINSRGGLSHNTVRAILEDRQGRFWFGTERGIDMLDKDSWTHFDTAEGTPQSTVYTMMLDKQDRVWAGTAAGPYRFGGRSFAALSIPQLAGKHQHTRALLQDRDGHVWIGFDGGGLIKIEGENFIHFTRDNGLNSNTVRTAVLDREGAPWFGTTGGISKYEKGGFKHFTEAEGLVNNTVWALAPDREGNLWVGTYRGGLDRFGGETFVRYTTADGLGDNVVRAVMEDGDGHLWFGTYKGGAVQLDGRTLHPLKRLTTGDGLVDNFVLHISRDRAGKIWFGTQRGVSTYVPRTGLFKNLTRAGGLSGNVIRFILEDRKGDTWIATNSAGLNRLRGGRFDNAAHIEHFSLRQGLNHDSVMSLLEDRSGRLWIATLGGICRYDGKTFTNLVRHHPELENLTMANCLLEDGAGNTWSGFFGGGLIMFPPPLEPHRGEPEPVTFTSMDGLSDDNVVSMVFGQQGNLWIGTEKGLNKLDMRIYRAHGRKVFTFYGRDEGFTGIECIHNAAVTTKRGLTWFGTLRGAMTFNPAAITANRVEPLTHITNLRVFFNPVAWNECSLATDSFYCLPGQVEFPYKDNHLTFDFVGISLYPPGKVRYRYKLEGFDKRWSPATTDTKATYSYVPPGNYTFYVKAGNSDDVWNKEPSRIRVTVHFPFWKTPWFYLLMILAAVLGVYGFVRLRERKLHKTRERLEKEVGLRTRELREEKERIERMNRELDKLSLVASRTENAVLIAGAEGEVEWVNDGFINMTGYTLAELVRDGRNSIKAFINQPDEEDKIEEGIREKKSVTKEVSRVTRDGVTLWLSVTVTPIFERNGRLKRLIIVGTDISPLKEAMDELHRYREHLEELVDARTIALEQTNEQLQDEIIERQEIERVLRESEERFRTLVQSQGEGTAITDTEEQLLFANPAAEEIFNVPQGELVGRNLREFIAEDQLALLEEQRLRREERRKDTYELEITRLDGEKRHLIISATPWVQKDEYRGTFGVFRDITERKRTEKELRKSKEAAEAATRAKSEFLANMSHELRTPLNAIIGYAQLLNRDTGLNPDQHKRVDIIDNSGKHLLTLINDLLDISKVEAGRMELVPNQFCLPDFLRRIAGIIQVQAEKKDIYFIYDTHPDLPQMVYADEQRLRQVLINLLSNGVKFTEAGYVALSTHYSDGVIRFHIEDSGCGIAPQDLDGIFTPFQQVGETADGEGTGLGLAISRKIVEMMAGTLNVKSKPGEGSVFWFDLDLTEIPGFQAPKAPSPHDVEGYKGERKTVLVADDTWQNRTLLVDMLSPLGFRLLEARDGAECLEKAFKLKPDVILLDLRMPRVDGFEVARRIRGGQDGWEPVIIGISASAYEETRRQCIEAGCDEFRPKPIQVETLVQAMARHLEVEWIYKKYDGDTPGRNGENEPLPPVNLPPADVQKLVDYANLGSAKRIKDILLRLEKESEIYHPVVRQLRRLVDVYRFDHIISFLKAAAGETGVNHDGTKS